MERNNMPNRRLEFLDYIIIAVVMIVPLTIGAYFAYKQHKGTTVVNYLLADRKVKYLAIAMSSFSTMVSTSTIVGIPAEMYTYGTVFAWHLPAQILVFPVYTQVFIPIYMNLNSCSMYTYFKLRFNTFLWKISAIFSILYMLLVLSVTIVASSNVFVRVMGIDMWTSSILVAFVCITYTTFGGMKAVIWTDLFQGIIIIVTMLLIVVIGTNHVEGLSNILTTSFNGHRLDIFDARFDLTELHTVWSSLFPYTLMVISFQVGNQAVAQRYLAAKDLKTAQRAATFGLTIRNINIVFVMYIGLVIYTANSKCDPVTGLGLDANQLVPDFIMKAFGPYPGFPGIFIGGIMAALLSTMSSILNALSAITIEDLCGALMLKMTEKKKVIVCQSLVVVYGMAGLLGIFIIQLFQNVFHASNALTMFVVATITIILVGTFLPQVNTKAVTIAFVCGTTISIWLFIGNFLYGHKHPTKPMDTSGCYRATNNLWVNSTGNGSIYEESSTTTSLWNRTDGTQLRRDEYKEGLWATYDISYMWATFLGTFCIVTLSYFLTFILGVENKCKDCMHLIPPAVQKLHRYFPKMARKIFLCDIYDDEVKDLPEEQQNCEQMQFTIPKTIEKPDK